MFTNPDQVLKSIESKKVIHGHLNLPDTFYPSWDDYIPFFDEMSQFGDRGTIDWRKIWINFIKGRGDNFPIIKETYRTLGRLIGQPITSCHCYAGVSPSARASPPHADGMEVFFVMMKGSMPWKVWENGCDYDDQTQTVTTRSTFSKRLYPGEFVYIPTGVPHCAIPDSSRVGFSFGWDN